MERKKFLWGMIVGLMCLFGCINGKEETIEKQEEYSQKDVGIMEADTSEFLGGRLLKLGNKGQKMTYFDYETHTLVPLCTKADCNHELENEGCIANLLAENLAYICIYQDKLWYLKLKLGESLGNVDTVLYRSDITGENEEKIYTLIGNTFPTKCNVLYDGYFYGLNTKDLYDEKGVFIGYTERLVRLDLVTGDIVEIEEEEQVDSYSYYIIGFQEGKLYYQYFPGKKYPNGAVMVYDCDSGEKMLFPIKAGMLGRADISNDYIMYALTNENEKKVYLVDLATQKESIAISVDDDAGYYLFKDEILIADVNKGYSRYNIETGEYQTGIRDEKFAEYFIIEYSTGDGYLGSISRDGYSVSYGYISREDFDKGGMPIILMEEDIPS